jgi:glyceraldehyde-3-phosphate dehydrogenase (NADP+)
MNAEEFQIKTLLNQDTYLVNGELKNGMVKHQQSLQFHLPKYEPTILGSIPFMGEKRTRGSTCCSGV